MSVTIEPSVLDDWYVVASRASLDAGPIGTRLLGRALALRRDAHGTVTAHCGGRPEALPVRERYGLIWTTLGRPAHEVPDIPEADEPDRRYVPCGAVTVRASGLRIVENFLDMAHFPYAHANILGVEPHTEVDHYETEIRRDVDEIWATDCRFFQPQAALSATGGILTSYIYRVPRPFVSILYKTCPNAEDRWDVICLFVQPMAPDLCRAHPLMFLIDEGAAATDLLHFQQTIFLQYRIILENQCPVLLPLEPRAEIPTRADALSVVYRRWLKEKGVRYGTSRQGGPAAVPHGPAGA